MLPRISNPHSELACQAHHEWSKVLSDPNSDSKAVRKNPLLYFSIVIGIALLYVGWIFFSRWQEHSAIEQKTEKERAKKQLKNHLAAVEHIGAKELALKVF